MRHPVSLMAALVGSLALTACNQPQNSAEVQRAIKSVNVIDESNLSDIMLTVGDPDEAVSYFQGALVKDPGRIDLTRGLAKSLGQDRIRINTVSPGWVMTERQIKLWLDAEGEQEIQRNQCLPDKLQAHDIARMVLFLAADDGAMCTAQEFKVDAGWN